MSQAPESDKAPASSLMSSLCCCRVLSHHLLRTNSNLLQLRFGSLDSRQVCVEAEGADNLAVRSNRRAECLGVFCEDACVGGKLRTVKE